MDQNRIIYFNKYECNNFENEIKRYVLYLIYSRFLKNNRSI